jgi:hypothetical protein
MGNSFALLMTETSNEPNLYARRGFLLRRLIELDLKIACIQEDKKFCAQKLYLLEGKIKKLEGKKVE